MIKEQKLLVLDTSYSLEAITQRGILKSVTCRDINGYFKHVWTVHPFATLVTSASWSKRYGKPEWHELNDRHTFIEGKIGRYSFLKFLGPINFFVGQIQLIIYLKKLIKKEGITIIRSGDMLYLGLMAWLLSKMCKIPFVVRVGGNHDKVFETTGKPVQKRIFLTRKIEKKVERFVLSRADLIAGANNDNLNFALNNGGRKKYSTIFRYGNLLYEGHFTDPESRNGGSALLAAINITSYKFLLYIGRLEKVKHPDHVIKVLADLKNKFPELKALFVGDGTMQNELKQLALNLKINDSIVFAGNQNQEWISKVIPLAAVVVSPHTGRALSEAALGAVAVAAYDIDWQAEMIENEVTGLLVPHPDQKKLSEATEKILNDPSFAKKMGHSLREKAINMLDPDKLNAHEISEYNKLLTRYHKK
ncbi:hypothetical protein BH09BAC2_BH09BAC2_03280 [soil metagenome]